MSTSSHNAQWGQRAGVPQRAAESSLCIGRERHQRYLPCVAVRTTVKKNERNEDDQFRQKKINKNNMFRNSYKLMQKKEWKKLK